MYLPRQGTHLTWMTPPASGSGCPSEQRRHGLSEMRLRRRSDRQQLRFWERQASWKMKKRSQVSPWRQLFSSLFVSNRHDDHFPSQLSPNAPKANMNNKVPEMNHLQVLTFAIFVAFFQRINCKR